MKITRDNYEIYFLDYYEGNLTDDQKTLLFHFLEKHADLKAEFELFSDEPIERSIVSYPQKTDLQHSIEERPINRKTIDEYCIAYLENDLKDEARLLFENYLEEHEGEKKIFETYKKTHLKREIHLYPYKKELLKPVARIKSFIPYIAAAASIIFFVMLFLINTPTKQTEIVQQNQNTAPELEKLSPKKMEPIQNQIMYDPDPRNLAIQQSQKEVENKQSTMFDNSDTPSRDIANLNKIEKLPPSPIDNSWHSKAVVGPRKNHSLASRPRPTRNELSIEYIKKRFLEETEVQKLSVWKLADAGLKGLGIISESEFDLSPSHDDNGKIESITFSTDNFTIKAPLKSKSDVTN